MSKLNDFELEQIAEWADAGLSQSCVARKMRVSQSWLRMHGPRELLDRLAANGRFMNRNNLRHRIKKDAQAGEGRKLEDCKQLEIFRAARETALVSDRA